MPKKTDKRMSFKNKLLIAAVSFLFLVLVIASFFGDRGLIEIYRIGRSTRALEMQVEQLRRQRDELLQEIEELNNNPQAIREKARELGLGSPDEKIILK
jgi:cell division protein FtsB